MIGFVFSLRQEVDEENQLFEKQIDRALQHEFVPQQRYVLIRIEKVVSDESNVEQGASN